MQFYRPVVMSIAGLDPCGGAGLLADIKAFEQNKVYGLGVTTAQTLQTERHFFSIRWESGENIITATGQMLAHYEVMAVKIGIVQSISTLHQVVTAIFNFNPAIKIVVDPVIRSTTAFDFWQGRMDERLLEDVLQKITLLTPNYKEAAQLVPGAGAKEAANKLSHYCSVLLKGGHNEEEPGVDYLYHDGNVWKLRPGEGKVFPKHGSGCVLSSAIAAGIALGLSLEEACRKAKVFTENFLTSNPSLLGYHVS